MLSILTQFMNSKFHHSIVNVTNDELEGFNVELGNPIMNWKKYILIVDFFFFLKNVMQGEFIICFH